MNRTVRNFWLDVCLFLLLGLDIVLVILSPRTPPGRHPGFGWHAHAFISALLTFGCLTHIVMHWSWFQAVLAGKTKSRAALIKNGIVTLMLLIAFLSGRAVLASSAAGGLHNVTGFIAMIGMSMHGIRHARWMIVTAKRLADRQGHLEQVPSSD